MTLLAGLRVAFPPRVKEYARAEPVARRQEASTPPVAAPGRVESKGEPIAVDDHPGNAFAVRVVAPAVPAVPPPMAVTPVTAAPAFVAAVPVPMAPPAPPLQVIGTYDDGGTPAVFVATSAGTLIARTGTVLLAEYRVTGITAQQVALMQVTTQQTFQLQIPGGAQ